MNRLITISEIIVNERFRKKVDDIKSLKNDIIEKGLLQHIVIDTNNVLVAGFRRLKACKELGWKKIPCIIIDPTKVDTKLCEISENTERENFAISDIVDIAKYVEKTRIGHRPKKGAKLAPFSTGKTRDIVAQLTGISTGQAGKIIDISKTVKKAPKKYKQLLEDLDSKKKSVNTVHQKLQIQSRKPTIVKIPKGQWNVLEFDFPWGYENQSIGITGTAGAKNQYPTLAPKLILEQEVPKFKKIIAKNSVAFMWVPVPLLYEIVQLQILERLGFTYKTMISWHKLIPKNIFGGRGLGY